MEATPQGGRDEHTGEGPRLSEGYWRWGVVETVQHFTSDFGYLISQTFRSLCNEQ